MTRDARHPHGGTGGTVSLGRLRRQEAVYHSTSLASDILPVVHTVRVELTVFAFSRGDAFPLTLCVRVPRGGIEPPTIRFSVEYSYQTSYRGLSRVRQRH